MATDTLALLIDGDNASPKVISGLLAEIANYGTASVKRIYGDWTKPNLNGWKECLLEHSIQPVQQFAYTTGKNATDGAMIIDAMDLLYTGRFSGLASESGRRPARSSRHATSSFTLMSSVRWQKERRSRPPPRLKRSMRRRPHQSQRRHLQRRLDLLREPPQVASWTRQPWKCCAKQSRQRPKRTVARTSGALVPTLRNSHPTSRRGTTGMPG